MKVHEMFFAGAMLIGSLGAANYRLGRCYWKHETVAKWIISLISAIFVIAPILRMLLVYYPGLAPRLISPFYAIIALLVLMGLSKAFRYCYNFGDHSVRYTPDPNRLYEVDDIPPMPTAASAK